MTVKGIDASQWQKNVNFEKVKSAGYKFVILRAGYGKYASQKDPTFEDNYRKAKAAGLGVGAYWYSYATTAEDARAEATVCMEAIKGKLFEYPIYFDLEEHKAFAKGRLTCSSMVETFCDTLEKAGYFAGLYISRSPLQTYITSSVANRYALWVAEYGSKCNYGGTYGMWQYTSAGNVAGINGSVDLDECYVDYPTIIKAAGLNGYPLPKNNADTADKPAKAGDVNGDGRVDVSDVAALAAHVAGKKKLE